MTASFSNPDARYPSHRVSDIVAAAAKHLAGGGLVAFPTETVYGLGADATSQAAVERVFKLKGRPANNPLIVHVSDTSMAQAVVASWPTEAERLAAAFWPGPLTLVLEKQSALPQNVTGGGTGVAVRCPDHPIALELLRCFGKPLVGPSANPSGRVSPTAAAHVRSYFADQEVHVLDGGACRAGIESTVLSLIDNDGPKILRPGVVTPREIAAALGCDPAVLAAPSPQSPKQRITAHGTSGALPAPGMLAVHYAPATRAILIHAAAIREALADQTPRIAALTISPMPASGDHLIIPMLADARGYAANLYAGLMRADAVKPDLIMIERPGISSDDALWAAILDRLERATSA